MRAMADAKAKAGSDGDLPDDIAAMSFEQALAELEDIVRQLESGERLLDDAIGAYERGAQLKRHCELKLRQAQVRVERISLAADGTPRAEPADIG
jgi:exodeoxyribonuclease VII small subunit